MTANSASVSLSIAAGGWFEAFDREEKSLGHFKSAKAASDKIMGAPRQ